MGYNIHAGHNPDGKVACGAVGIIRESTEARKVKETVKWLMVAAGETVYDCTVDNGTGASDVLKKIVTKCNANNVECDCSLHFNAGRKDSKGDGSIGGCEVLIYSLDSEALDCAIRIANNMKALGFKLRSDGTSPAPGVKVRKDLYFLKHTNAPALLVEICFVDDKDDVNLYLQNNDKIALAIAEGLMNRTFQKTKDVNGDGRVDALDALEMLKQKAGLTPKTGDYDAMDALEVLKEVAGIKDTPRTKEVWGKVKGTGVRVRKGPGTNYPVVCGVSNGQKVRIWKEQNGWTQIDSNKWVKSDYIAKNV